jgi:quinol monooxygenase YgiN
VGYGKELKARTGKETLEMHSRVNNLQTRPEAIESVQKVTRTVVLPRIRELPGFKGYIVLGDRSSGKAVGITLWEDEGAMKKSDETATRIRPHVEEATEGTMQSVETFEVLLAHLEPGL